LRGGAVRMKAFLSLPAYCCRSSSVQPACTSIAGPDTAPTVPTDHACGTASTMNGTGAVAIIEKCSFSHPRPTGVSHVSSCTLANPHDFISDIAHAPARVAFGDQVSRGPYTSDSQLMMSMTCELFISSDLMRSIVASSTFSCAASGAASGAASAPA